jgi:hypothetical protein
MWILACSKEGDRIRDPHGRLQTYATGQKKAEEYL